MSHYENILVVLGPERHLSAAVHRGTELARRGNAKLHLVLFDHHPLIDSAAEMVGTEVAALARREFFRERSQWLNEQASALSQKGLRVECDLIWAPVPHEAVLGKILEVNPDLVIVDVPLDSHKPPRLHPTPLIWKLLRLCPAALMLVQSDAKLVPHRLLAAVDVSPGATGHETLNKRIVQGAQDLAQLCQAGVDVVSAFTYIPLQGEAIGFAPEIYDLADQTHSEAFKAFLGQTDIGADHGHRLIGEPASAIAQCTHELNSDLLVIGAAYHSAWDRLLLGTTAETLLRHIGCDVLALKPNGFLEELARHIDLNELRELYAQQQKEPGT